MEVGGAAMTVAVIVLLLIHTNMPQYALSLDASSEMEIGEAVPYAFMSPTQGRHP